MLIDTAGRYTTQDSDAEGRPQEWLAFLDLLKKNRPKQPINGVLVAISLEDLIDGDAGGADRACRRGPQARSTNCTSSLKVDFPVYVLFTKADLVAGFIECFGELTESERRRPGATPFRPRTARAT